MGKFKKFGPKTAKTGDESSNKNNLQGVTKKKNKHPSPINKTKINQNETVKQEVMESIKKEKLSVPNDKIKVEKPKPKSVIDEIIETHAPSQTSKNKKKRKRQPQSGETKSVQKSGKKNAENMKNKQKSELPVEKMETDGNSGNKKKSRKRKKKHGNATTSPSLEETKFQPKMKKQKKSLVNGDQQDVKEPSSNPKTKKDELKPKSKKETVKTEGKETNSKSDQKSKKKFEANDSVDGDKDSRNPRSIFIGNVPVTFKKKKLLKLLKEKGNVERLWTRGFIPKSDQISKKTAAIANLLRENHPPVNVYVLYRTAAEAQEALTLNGVLFDDHRLRVTPSQYKHFPTQKGVFVGNLPYNVTDNDLFDMFSKCGEIVTTRVIRDNGGKGKGFAYVNFSSSDAVELALKLNDEKLHDREIRVTRIKNEKQIKKIQKKKAPAANAALPKQKHKKLKTKGGPPSDKSSDKFQKKKKKLNSVELKKKVLAKKLTNKKRKEKTSE